MDEWVAAFQEAIEKKSESVKVLFEPELACESESDLISLVLNVIQS